MLFLAVLLLATGVAAICGRHRAHWRDHARRGLAGAMAFAGVSHLLRPEPFLQHLPEWVPSRELLVAVTGVVEIALGLALVAPRRVRPVAGAVTASYLVAVFPANVYVAVADVDVDGQPGGIARWIRLPLQALFVAWALWATRDGVDARPEPAPSHAPAPLAH